MTDPIADMLTRIRNANVAMHDTVKMPGSKLKLSLASILEREGYISGFTTVDRPGAPRRGARDPDEVHDRALARHRRASSESRRRVFGSTCKADKLPECSAAWASRCCRRARAS
jgi:ribosomal protein S8